MNNTMIMVEEDNSNRYKVMINTGEMCMIMVEEPNRLEGFRFVDIGNYYKDKDGNKCVILSKEDAIKYNSYIDVPIYVKKEIKVK